MDKTLDQMMSVEPGHIVRILADGTAVPYDGSVREPEETLYVEHDDGQISDEQEWEFARETERAYGWEVLSGHTACGGITVRHPSEYIGGGLEEEIRETPGLYVAVPVDLMDYRECKGGDDKRPCETAQGGGECEHMPNETQFAGWAVLRYADKETGE